MGFDSSANLLFVIAGDSAPAQAAMGELRGVMENYLGNMTGAFEAFSADVENLGWAEALTNIGPQLEKAMLGVVGAAAAAGASLVELGRHQMEFAETVEQGTRATGLTTEQISGLMFAADQTGLSTETLNRALVRFAVAVSAAADPTSKQAKAFGDLGIQQADINAGQTDLYTLLMKTSDGFHTHADGANKDAASLTLFRDRSAVLTQTLDMGSAAFHTFAQRAQETGNILTEQDAEAAKITTLAWRDLRAEVMGFEHQLGKATIPLMADFALWLQGITVGMKAFFTTALTWKDIVNPFAGVLKQWANAEAAYYGAMEKGAERILAAKQAMEKPVNVPPVANPHGSGHGEQDDQPKQATEDWLGFSNILQQVKSSIAGATSEEAKISAETDKLSYALQKAYEQFFKLSSEGKLSMETVGQQSQAYWQSVAAITQLGIQRLTDLGTKHNAAEASAAADLRQRIEQQQQGTHDNQIVLWDDEIQKLVARFQKEGALTIANWALLEQLQQAGYAKIQAAQSQAFAKELVGLNNELAQMVNAHQTAQQRIETTYQQDLQRFSAAEEAKKVIEAGGAAYANMIHLEYERLRAAALQKYQTDLQALHNSTGWQGVFGNTFAQAIRGNEALWKEWANSTNQSMMMVRVSLEAMKEMGQQAFQSFAQGMGSNSADAIVYSKSIGQAMQAALASTLESLAAQSISYAIYSTGLGLLRLAQYDYVGASNAFAAAAEFGILGVATALAGRAIAPSQSTAAGSSSAANSAASPASSSATTGASTNTPMVSVYVYGHVYGTSGVDQLAALLSDAVRHRDVKLISSQTKNAAVVIR